MYRLLENPFWTVPIKSGFNSDFQQLNSIYNLITLSAILSILMCSFRDKMWGCSIVVISGGEDFKVKNDLQ